MGLARSTFYYKNRVDIHAREQGDVEVKTKIEQIHLEFPSYGYRRITKQLRRDGVVVNSKRIRRIMRKFDLRPVVFKKLYTRTTDSKHHLQIYPNLLKGLVITQVNKAWAADITYIKIQTCFVYLGVLIDLYSRKVVGWALSRRLDQKLCLEALRMAIKSRTPKAGCIHHSDRGIQYASVAYIQELKLAGMKISMSRRANCYDNAFAETFFKTLKYEEVHLCNYETYFDVLERVPYFIEDVYNRKRLHSGIGYLPPSEFEARIGAVKQTNRPVLSL